MLILCGKLLPITLDQRNMKKRLLKFKVWNKEKKEWHQFADVLDLNNGTVYCLGMDWETVLEPSVVVQYVNMNDSEGREIYEGDILEYEFPKYDERMSPERKAEYGNKHIVVFHKETHDYFPGFSTSSTFNQYGACKIIGNIFENYDIVENDNFIMRYKADSFQYLLK